jgi:hypothetical protein
VPATENAAGATTGLMTGYGAEPPAPAGSVAGVLAGVAQPPPINPDQANRGSAGRGVVDTSGMSPQDKFIASEILAGRGTNAISTLLPFGQTAAGGAGSRYDIQGDIYKAQHMPRDVAPGTTTVLDPTKGIVPGNVVTAGDPAQLDAQKANLLSTQKDADMRVTLGNTATNTEGDLIEAKNLYNQLVGGTDIRSVASDKFISWLAANSGFQVDQLYDPAVAKTAIKRILKASIGSSLQAVQGDPNSPVRGILQQTNDYIPDPDKLNDVQFNKALDDMLKVVSRQKEEALLAHRFQVSPQSAQDAIDYHNGLEALRLRREQDNQAARQPPADNGSAASGGETYVFSDLASAQAAIKAGQIPKGSKVRVGNQTFGAQ